MVPVTRRRSSVPGVFFHIVGRTFQKMIPRFRMTIPRKGEIENLSLSVSQSVSLSLSVCLSASLSSLYAFSPSSQLSFLIPLLTDYLLLNYAENWAEFWMLRWYRRGASAVGIIIFRCESHLYNQSHLLTFPMCVPFFRVYVRHTPQWSHLREWLSSVVLDLPL